VDQLLHERVLVAELSTAQRNRLFSSLPSLTIEKHKWYLRRQALAEAEKLLEATAATESEEADRIEAEDQAGVPITSVSVEGNDDLEEDEAASPASISRSWEEAAAEHAATAERLRPGDAQRKKERDEKKAHKRRVKAEQRERREVRELTAIPASVVASRRPGSAHKPKRPSVHEHRAAAQPTRWEQSLRRLEEVLGDDLCGLSGLELAR